MNFKIALLVGLAAMVSFGAGSKAAKLGELAPTVDFFRFIVNM